MADSLAILADWGTSRLRVWLCDCSDAESPKLLGSASGPGVKYARNFGAVFSEQVAQLPAHPGDTPVVVAGMIGSNIGWQESGYMACPFDWQDYAERGRHFHYEGYPITILPGACFENDVGYRDIMRGEEVQLLGAMHLRKLGGTTRLLCLPGTHTKWAIVENASLKSFASAMQGELFDILSHHSVLIAPGFATSASSEFNPGVAFDEGVALLEGNRGLSFVQALFSVRCRQVSGELAAEDATAFLSGIVVAADVRDAGMPMLAREGISKPILLLGGDALSRLYARAMDQFEVSSEILDGEACTLRGLAAARAELIRA